MRATQVDHPNRQPGGPDFAALGRAMTNLGAYAPTAPASLNAGPRMRLLVNADDLGASRKVNDATFALMEKGVLRSASLLANARVFDEAASRAKAFPRCSFGVHLNVTHGAPLGSDPALAPLLDADGRFHPDAIRSEARRATVREAVVQEWSRQIERVAGAGINISHLDSHDHVHTIPWLSGTVAKVQERFAILRLRVPRTLEREYSLSGFPRRLGKRLWQTRMRARGAQTTDQLFGLADFRRLSEKGRRFDGQTLELMVHPGSDAFAEETALLSSEWWNQEIGAHTLISYAEL